jgi:predicted TIM-barrel fold metal-dependent hydrolase
MIIDAHTHLGPTLKNHSGSLEFDAVTADNLVPVLDEVGIDLAILMPPLYEGGPYDDPDYKLANYAVAAACAQYPDRFRGYARVNPNRKQAAVAEFLHCLDDLGLHGLILHPDWESFYPTTQSLMWPLAEICAERGLPMSFHVGYYPKCQPMLFVPLAEAFPSVPIYLKHIGYEYWRDAIIVAQRYPNVYLETAGNTSSGEIYAAIREAGADKVCYGSDLPYILPHVVIQKIRCLPISDEEKEQVLVLNSARINKLPVGAAVGVAG